MKTIRKHMKGVSIGLASVMLMAFSAPVQITNKENKESDETTEIADIYFDEDCTSCKYITIYNTNNDLVFDGLVKDVKNITDSKLNQLLSDSDYLMSNQITDYYIITD